MWPEVFWPKVFWPDVYWPADVVIPIAILGTLTQIEVAFNLLVQIQLQLNGATVPLDVMFNDATKLELEL